MKQRVVKLNLILLMCSAFLGFQYPASADVVSYNFTNAGSTGMYGPTQESVTASYANTSLAGSVRVLQRGYQLWTVPVTDTYTIEAAGAAGGSTTYTTGGRGRIIKINVALTQGQVLKILVGQMGGKVEFTSGGPGTAGGGGGGTFVVDSATGTAILVSGGGGGGSSNTLNVGVNGQDAPGETITSGTNGTNRGGSYAGALGGTAGHGGASSSNYWTANSGAGFLDNGGGNLQSSTYSAPHGFASDGVGGQSGETGLTVVIHGGFGGGSGPLGTSNYEANAGAGGGYSGGGGGGHLGTGGGGGNFKTGQFVSTGLNAGHGYVTITRNLIPATLTLNAPSSLVFRTLATVSVDSNSPGRVTFFANGKRIPGCISKLLSGSGSSYSVSCSFRPTMRGSTSLSASISPSGGYSSSSISVGSISTSNRAGNR
jgi:hypothetical protein